MKKSVHILLILLITLGMLAVAPIVPAYADCIENAVPDPDEWTCSGADADGMATNNTDDIVIVVSGATVDNLAVGGIAVQAQDGTVDDFAVTNDGIISENAAAGIGISTQDGDVLNTNTVTADGIGGAAITTVGGDVLNTSTISADGTAGAGIITLNGEVINAGSISADGMAGAGIVTIDGNVLNIGTITADETSGTGVFTNTGSVVNVDTITANGDSGTGIATGSGANAVVNIGDVSATGTGGIAIVTGLGNDEVTLGAGSTTTGDTTAVSTGDNNDIVSIEDNATVNGIIDGGADNDLLEFTFFTQNDLAGLFASGGTISYNGNTYTWVNFEQLVGLLIQAQQNGGKRVYFRNKEIHARGLLSGNANGINVIAEPGTIAFIPFSSLPLISLNSGVRFQLPNDKNWFVVVINRGPYELNPERTWYQVNIYDGNGALVSDEQGFVY